MWDRRFAYQPPTSGPRIAASGFLSLLPTPSAEFNDQDPDVFLERREREKAKGRNGNGFGLTLGMATALLPTPTTDDASNTTRDSGEFQSLVREVHRLLPTPLAGDAEGGRTTKGAGRPDETGLRNTVKKLLPTPGARDGENSSEQGFRYYEGQGDNPTLLGAARTATGQLRHSTPGAFMAPPSSSGNDSSDDPLPGQLTIADA